MTYSRYILSDKGLITSIWYCYISTLAGNYKTPCFAVTAYAYYKSCIKLTKCILQIIYTHLKFLKTNAYLFLKQIIEHSPFLIHKHLDVFHVQPQSLNLQNTQRMHGVDE